MGPLYTLGEMAEAEPFRGEVRMIMRKARERLGMSQNEFARALSQVLGHPVKQSRLSEWESGRVEPMSSVLLAVADLGGGSLDILRSRGSLGDRLDHLEDELAGISRILSEHEREIASVRSAVGMAGPAPAAEGALPAHFKERIDQLYRGLTDARHLLGLEPRSRPARRDTAAEFRALHENLSEVRRAVGIPQTPFPSEGEALEERVAILEDQMRRAWRRKQLQQAKEADTAGRAAEEVR